MNGAIDKIGKIYELLVQWNNEYFKIWKNGIVFTWRWWITFLLLILPWVIWLVLRKRNSSGRLFIVGFFIYFITSLLDSVGIAFGLWRYNITPLPYVHSFFVPWDLSLFPVTIMLMIQYKPKASPYLKAVIFALFCALVFEPIFTWLRIYELLKWSNYYGIPIYFVIYLLAHKISKLKSFEEL
jgi:hypothetical protein